jgi:plasmid maintenance system antidote protein VapI
MRTRIKEILDEQGRKQTWLAKQLITMKSPGGVSPQHLTLIINGKVSMTVIRANQIADILGVTPRELYEEVK